MVTICLVETARTFVIQLFTHTKRAKWILSALRKLKIHRTPLKSVKQCETALQLLNNAPMAFIIPYFLGVIDKSKCSLTFLHHCVILGEDKNQSTYLGHQHPW